MGMDLSALNHTVRGYHANWSLWRFLRETLQLVGANTEKMARDNSGDVVDRETALDWACRLQVAMDSGRLKLVPGPDGPGFEVCSLDEGVPVRKTDYELYIRDFVEFCERSCGFEQR